MKIIINGFGRIGRAVTRQILSQKIHADLYIHDKIQNKNLLFYLLEYDSIYGRFQEVDKTATRKRIHFLTNKTFSHLISDSKVTFDFLVDTSPKQYIDYKNLINKGTVKKIVISHLNNSADYLFVSGVNESFYNPQIHHIVSVGICDVVAIAPILKFFNEKYKIISCHILTIHPWLSYQNLLDNTSLDYMNSLDYGLYRSAVDNLIPKSTTAVTAILKVLPMLKGKLDGFAFRVPTATVTSANISLITDKKTSLNNLLIDLNKFSRTTPVVSLNDKPLVSKDFQQSTYSCIIDTRFIKILPHNLTQIMLWYDNEWGYSARIVDFISINTK